VVKEKRLYIGRLVQKITRSTRHPKNDTRGTVVVGALISENREGIVSFGIAGDGLIGGVHGSEIAHFFRARCFLEIFNPSGRVLFADTITWAWDPSHQVFYPRGEMDINRWVEVSISSPSHVARMSYPTARY
jgi:hypothetical protein